MQTSLIAWPDYVIAAGRACASAMARESDGYISLGEIEEQVGQLEVSIQDQHASRRISLMHDVASTELFSFWANAAAKSLERIRTVLIPGIRADSGNLAYRLEAIARMGNLWGYDQALRIGVM